jgi:hypothetical protein
MLDDSVVIPVVLYNQGLEGDSVSLSVEGIPGAWVSVSSPSALLIPGQQVEVTLTIRPTVSEEGAAGRHPFKILAASQAVPGQVTTADCILTIAELSRFRIDLTPQRSEAGTPARLTVENQGNVEDVFTLTWQSPGEELDFEPFATQQLHVEPGQAAMAQFSAKPRNRPLFGQGQALPFITHVQASTGGTRSINGEVAAKALVPTWLLVVALLAVLACVCLPAAGVGLSGILDQAPPETPDATVPADQDQPAEPPPEQTTEPQPEPPAEPPPEQPAEPIPEEPLPEEPAPGDDEGSVPPAPRNSKLFLTGR